MFSRPRRHWLAAGMLPGLLAAVWLGGLLAFVAAIPDAATPLSEERTDAIVVLTGGSGRLGMGLRLLGEHRADKLFVSGVYRGVDVRSLVEMSQRSPAEIACCIGIGHAVDTIGNAAETAAWMRAHGHTSLRLVTSDYHMPRSLLEFREAMPEARLVPHPVFPEHVKRDRWWAWPGTAALIVGEYTKFTLAWVRHRLADALGPLPPWPLPLEEEDEEPGPDNVRPANG